MAILSVALPLPSAVNDSEEHYISGYIIGFIHLTGKFNYKSIHVEWNKLYASDTKDFLGDDISLLRTDVDVALKAAMIYWKLCKCNAKADGGSTVSHVKKITKAVNGGYNGLADRKKHTKKAYKILKGKMK